MAVISSMGPSVQLGCDTTTVPASRSETPHNLIDVADEDDEDEVERALAAAVQNAALEAIIIPEDEQSLIRLHQSGQISKAEFLRRAAELAQRKSGGAPT